MNIYSAIDELQLLEEILMNLITLELGRWGKKKKSAFRVLTLPVKCFLHIYEQWL